MADLSSEQTWTDLIQDADIIFHLAAQTSVYVANSDPVADLQASLVPMIRILEAVRQYRQQAIVIFAGTVTQVGLTHQWPGDESLPDRPVTCYDLHKLASEHYLESYARQGLVRGTTLRLCNVYGPGTRTGSKDRGILNLMIRKALANETLTIYGEGQQMRDYIHIADVANAFVMAARHIDKTNGRHFVLGSGTGHTIAQAIELVAQQARVIANTNPDVVHVQAPAGMSPIEARDFVADTRQFKEATGWQATINLAEGIDDTIKFYRSKGTDS